MVKIHCDRCGQEIVGEHYYTIYIGEVELIPSKRDYSITACADALASVYNQSAFEQLNSTKMYCKDCKDKVEAYLWSNTNSSLT